MVWLTALYILALASHDSEFAARKLDDARVSVDCSRSERLALVANEPGTVPTSKEYGLPQPSTEGEEEKEDGDGSTATLAELWKPTLHAGGPALSGVVGMCRRLHGVNPFARPCLLRC